MNKAGHKPQNFTGNRYHAPEADDYNEKLAANIATRICELGHWDFVDVEGLKLHRPGVWHLVCEKTREIRRHESTELEATLRADCLRREAERYEALAT